MGLAIALAFMAQGGRAVLADLKPEPEALRAHAGLYRYVTADIADEGQVRSAVAEAEELFGRLDYLVNVAGVLWFDRDRSVLDMDFAVWDQVFAINLKAMAFTIRHAVPLMRKAGGGAMVHFSTVQCLRGDPAPQDAYSTSKAGVAALSRSAAIQFAGDGIRSNTIFPGVALTPMQARWDGDRKTQEAIAAHIPLQRIGKPEDMANACLFLLSDEAAYVTGTDLIVDGGLSAKL